MKKLLLVIAIIFAGFTSSYASHLMGGQIAATYISSDSSGSHYVLDLEVYRDSLGVNMSLFQNVDVYVLDTSGTYAFSFSHTMVFDTTSGGAMSSMSYAYGVEIYNFSDSYQIFSRIPQLLKVQNLLFYSKKLDLPYQYQAHFFLWIRYVCKRLGVYFSYRSVSLYLFLGITLTVFKYRLIEKNSNNNLKNEI